MVETGHDQSDDAAIASSQPNEKHIQEVVASLTQEHSLNAKEAAFMAQVLRDNPNIDEEQTDFAAFTTWIRGHETESTGENDILSDTLGAEGLHITGKALQELI